MENPPDKGQQNRQIIEEMSALAIKALSLYGFAGAMFTIALTVANSADNWVVKVAAIIMIIPTLLVVVIGVLNTVFVSISAERLFSLNPTNKIVEVGVAGILSLSIIVSLATGGIAVAHQVQQSIQSEEYRR